MATESEKQAAIVVFRAGRATVLAARDAVSTPAQARYLAEKAPLMAERAAFDASFASRLKAAAERRDAVTRPAGETVAAAMALLEAALKAAGVDMNDALTDEEKGIVRSGV